MSSSRSRTPPTSTPDPQPPVPAGPAAVCHLVHDAPAATHRAVLARAARRGATYAFVTDRRLPNPWDGLPTGWGASA